MLDRLMSRRISAVAASTPRARRRADASGSAVDVGCVRLYLAVPHEITDEPDGRGQDLVHDDDSIPEITPLALSYDRRQAWCLSRPSPKIGREAATSDSVEVKDDHAGSRVEPLRHGSFCCQESGVDLAEHSGCCLEGGRLMLSEQARRALYVRCANHTVAHCDRCDEEWFHEELRDDVAGSGGQGVLCRNCLADLTPTIQRHLFMCLLTWTHEEQMRTRVPHKHHRELRDYAPGARAEHEALRQRSDETDQGERGLRADRKKLAVTPTALDREAGDVGTKRAYGGAHGWLVLGAGFAVLVLSGIPVWKAARGPLSEAPGSLRPRSTKAPASPGAPHSAPRMDVHPAARAVVPYGTDGGAMSAPRNVPSPPTARYGIGSRDATPHALARSPVSHHYVRGDSKPDKPSAVPRLQDHSEVRTPDEKIQSP